MNTNQQITTEILFASNSEPQDARLAQLKQLFPDCFDKNGVFLVEKMAQALRASDIETSKEYYTLNWLGKSYAKVIRDLPPETLLAENHEHNSRPEHKNSQNLLIKGDNLEVLKHLTTAYKSAVKMIYIDPPYNTGSDGFVYQDARKFSAEELVQLGGGIDLEEAKRILDFTAKKSNSHSAWLTFMYPRLYIARELLKDDGVIFISIDDNEQAQLKLLCDEIFGEENFVANCIWERAYAPVNLKKHFSESHDFLLCYAKNIEQAVNNGLPRSNEANNRYSNPDNDPRGVWQSSDLSVGPAIESNIYEITAPSGRKIMPPSGYSWRLNKERFDEFLKDNRIWFGEDGNNTPRIKRFLSEVKDSVTPMTIWKYQEIGHSQSASQDLKKLFDGKAYFTYPKPVELIKRTLQLYSDKNSIILDFFAGSGTTAHAVMQLNAEDKGNRQFIMVQLPETTDPKSEAHKAGYQTIFDITKARIEKAAAKIQADNPDYQGDLGFKIFETVEDFRTLPEFNSDSQQAALLFPDLSQLNDGQIQTLLTTWRVYDGQKLPENIQPIDLAGYAAYLCDKHLYLLHNGFASEQIKTLLDKLDEDKAFVIERIVLLGDAIDSAKQQELNQAIKTYANKKSLNINVLVRY